ncbi:hypothetical protein MMC17_000614 [Xylographa soralifera]|nr:hypothetical protein [Xylographa soralifera]
MLQKRLANATEASSSRAVSVPSLSSSSSGQDQNSSGSTPVSKVGSASDSRSRSDDGDFAPHSRQQSGEYRYRDTIKASFDRTQSTDIALDDIEGRQKQLMVEAESQRHLEDLNYKSGRLDFDGVDPELGMHLLSLHWNRQHHSFLIVHRPTFMRDMACAGRYFSKLLLNAIYFGASKFSSRIEVQSERYRQRARTLISQSIDHSEEKSAAWLNAGIAFRMIIDLGMQVDALPLSSSHRSHNEDVEVRRRVFWAAFVIDKVQSLYQGRPVGLEALHCQVPLIFLDQYEEAEDWKPFGFSGSTYSGVPTSSLSTFTNLCKLSLIMNRISNAAYAEQGVETASTNKDLHVELEQWYAALPIHLKYDSLGSFAVVPPPHVLSLLALYHVLLIQLHHPFVTAGQLHAGQSPTLASDSFAVCTTAAKAIVRLLRAYDRMFSICKAPYLISFVTYVSATVLVRMVAQDPAAYEAHEYLQTCIAVLKANEATNRGVRSAMDIILKLMKRTGIDGGYELVQSERGSGSSQPRGVNIQPGAFFMDNLQSKRYSAALHTDKGDYSHTEPDYNIDMALQDFAKEFDGRYQTASNPGSAQSHLSPMSYSLDSRLGNTAQQQMLLDDASVDFDVSIGLVQDPLQDYGTSRTFF